MDSAVQYAESIAGKYDSWQPVLMAWWWGVLNNIHSGPAIFLAQNLLIYWTALLIIAISARPYVGRWSIAIVALGFTPSTLLVMGQIWKDVFFSSLAILAIAIVFRAQMNGKMGWLSRSSILVVLTLAVGSKTNGITAAFFVTLYWVVIDDVLKSRSAKAVAVTIACLFFLVAPKIIVGKSNIIESSPLQYIQSYDLLGIGIRQHEVLLPSYITTKVGITPGNAKSFFWDGSNNLLFYNTRAGNLKTFDKSELAELSSKWVDAIKHHPLDYLRVRFYAFKQLMRIGETTPAWVVEAKSIDNPWGFSFTSNALSEALERTTKDYPWLYFPWIYITLVGAGLFATPLVHKKLRGLNITLAVSALAFAAPHFFVSPASDYRYLHFVTLCALLQSIIVCAGAVSVIATISAGNLYRKVEEHI